MSALLIFIALGFSIGAGSTRNLRQACRAGRRRRLAARADPGDVHLLGLERRGVRRRGDPRSGPQRAAARSALGTLAVVAIYLLLNLLYLYVLPVGELAQVQGSVLDVVAERLLGVARRRRDGHRLDRQHRGEHQRDDVRRAARLLRDGARRRCSSARAARIHPRYHTPATSIVAQAVWSGLLVLSGSANALTTYTGFAVVLFAGVAVAALFVLRQREPDAPRPFKALGLSARARRSS